MLHMLRLRATTATTATATAARAASCHGTAARRLHASAPRAFLFRSLDDVARDGHVVSTPQSHSSRLFVRGDGLGFSVQHEVFRRGSAPVRLEFRNHVVAVVVTQGRGRLQLLDAHGAAVDRHEHALEAGSSFALSAAEPAALTVESDELHVVSVMNPPLVGPEQKNEETGVFPVIDQDGVARESFDHAAIRRLCEPPESLKGGSSPMKDDPLF